MIAEQQAEPPVAATERGPGRGAAVAGWLGGRQAALTAVAVGLFAFFSIFATRFFTLDNVFDMARLGTFMLVVGVPLTFLFITREIDISVGSQYGLAAVLMGVFVVHWGLGPWPAALLTVVAGGLMGSINGFVSTVIGVPSFICTLGMYSLLRGATYVVTGGQSILYTDDGSSSFYSAANGTIGQMPTQILWALAVVAIGAFVLHYTPFGAHVYATGGNDKAARASGISTRRVKFLSFMATGLACGLAGALTGGWLREGSPETGTGFELQAFAAIIIGGVALTGGSGSIYGTFLGVAIVSMLANGLVLIGAAANWNEFFIGLIIVSVATAEVAINRRSDLARAFRQLRPGRR
jgi:ribose transport system permease protein